MVKKDGKWAFESGYSDVAKELNEIFAGGRIY